MIFSKLFKPKWQHDNPQIRLKAITQLSPETPSQLATLTTLAKGDKEAGVRRSALDKINKFELWWQTAQKDKDEKLARIALEKTRLSILGKNDLSLSLEQKNNFINTCKNNALLEELARDSSGAVSDEMRCTLLSRFKKAVLDLDLALNDKNLAVAKNCFERIDDKKAFERLATKAVHQEIKQAAEEKLNTLRDKEQKPIELRSQLSLVLSKLLALKDKTDYGVIKQQGEVLVEEWSGLQSEFHWLDEEEKAELREKYHSICQKVDSATSRLKDAWFEAQGKEKQARERAKLIVDISDLIEQAHVFLKDCIENSGDEHLNAIETLIARGRDLLVDTVHSGRDIDKQVSELNRLEASAKHLPEYAEQVANATRLLGLLSQHNEPTELEHLDERLATFQDWHQQWKERMKPMILPLPESLADAAKMAIQSWKEAIAELQSGQDQKIKQMKAKFRELNRLISGGKYNAAFGLFSRLSAWYEELTETNQQKIEREYSQLHEKIDDLSDWKEYIAIPRKKELLQEMQAILEAPEQDPMAQAKKVKQLRHVWLLLGNVKTDENAELNEAFNQVSEAAFAPCRSYYQEQEKIRDDNFAQKIALCEQVEGVLAEMDADTDSTDADRYNAVGSKIGKLYNAWKKIGVVDREKYKALNARFFDVYRPLRNKINQYHDDNAKAKQALIDKAASFADQEDSNAASQELKNLQAKWKTIGFAGPNKDRVLWNVFRQANDAVFSQRERDKKQKQDSQKTLFDGKQSALKALLEQAEKSTEVTECNALLDEAKALMVELDILSAGQIAKLARTVENIDELSRSLVSNKQVEKKQAVVKSLFDNIIKAAAGEAIADDLDNKWKLALSQFSATSADESIVKSAQHDLVIKIELGTETSSEPQDKDRRMELQVEMLAAKMSAGGIAHPDSLLQEWLTLGKADISSIELSQLQSQQIKRIEKAFANLA